ncbi:MAG TPA: histidinol-phosphate transaminase [Candidatus Saccharimonadia bacterium]|nr:histidinol-phosphate transaminase [Candidatus Saccharimonadia bacterium]
MRSRSISAAQAPMPTDVVAALRAYDPGHDLPSLRNARAPGALVELGSNENSFGPSPRVLEALRCVTAEDVFRYPDPLGLGVRRALSLALGVAVEQVLLGNGSHELLMLAAQCYAGPGHEVVFSEFGFAVFPIATAAVGATPRVAPARARGDAMPRGHDLDALAAQLSPRTKLVYLANPNNPTGTWFDRDALAAFLARVPPTALVVLDEAYHEYTDVLEIPDGVKLVASHPNVLVTRTFSKGYGLAGLRLGYAVGHPNVVATLNRLRESFNANALALVAAGAALADPHHVALIRAKTRAERTRVGGVLTGAGFVVHPSQTNFLLVDFGQPAEPIESKLLAHGVVVRPMGGYGLPTCLRVSIGRPAENDRLLLAFGA